MYGFSGSGCVYVPIIYCLRPGRLRNAWIFRFGRRLCSNSLLFEAWKWLDVNCDFASPIEEKISGLEGSHVAILYCLRLGRLGNAWIPESTLEALASRARR